MQVNDFVKDQKFVEKRKPSIVWSLLDITEAISLLHPENGKQIVVHLLDKKTRKIKRILYVHFESNFVKVENTLIDKVTELDRLFLVDELPGDDCLQD
jgi:hypothetical protein